MDDLTELAEQVRRTPTATIRGPLAVRIVNVSAWAAFKFGIVAGFGFLLLQWFDRYGYVVIESIVDLFRHKR